MPANLLYPATTDLQPGDLLFPKKPGDTVVAFQQTLWTEKALPNTLQRAGLRVEHRDLSVKNLRASTDVQDAQAQRYVGLWHSRIAALLAPADGADAGDWLAAIGDLSVPSLLSLGQALMAPFADDALGDWVGGLGFTLSHVAMAFEQGGQWYVMEAGCTDFSHYRVCISPYLDPDDAQRDKGQARGWAKRRADLGQRVWSARHQGLKDKALQATHVPTILDHCKNFLSVPYGILEPGMMSNPDRMYCAELLQRGFAQVPLRMDDKQEWTWVLKQLGSALAGLPDGLKTRLPSLGRFPLLSPKMIYKDPRVQSVFFPTDASGHVQHYA